MASVSLAALEGREWVLWRSQAGGAQTPQEPEITLRLAEGRFAGVAGCNRYFADARAGEGPNSLIVGQAGSTHMACAPDVLDAEQSYLAALQGATSWRLDGDLLELDFEHDGAKGTLSFRARQAGGGDE